MVRLNDLSKESEERNKLVAEGRRNLQLISNELSQIKKERDSKITTSNRTIDILSKELAQLKGASPKIYPNQQPPSNINSIPPALPVYTHSMKQEKFAT